MIINMHIPKTYRTWIEPTNQKTVSTMCGTRSLSKYCGIPGITYQPYRIIVGNKVGRGWCRRCCENLREDIEKLDGFGSDLPGVGRLYVQAYAIATANLL